MPADNFQYLYYYHYYYCNYYYLIILITVATDNDDEISKKFGGCAKKFSNLASLFPSFNAVQGTTYFTEGLKRINHMKVFTIISWIPKLKEPNILLSFLRHFTKKLRELSSV